MSEDDKKSLPQISESNLQVIKDAHESYKRVADNLAEIIPKIPKFDFPKFELPEVLDPEKYKLSLPEFPELPEMINPDVVREQNAWERHKEVLDVQNALLGIQSELLQEQKANTKLTQWVFRLAILGTAIALVSLIIGILK